MTENPTKNTMLADESLFDEQITKDFQQLNLNVVSRKKLFKKIKCPKCRDLINDILIQELDTKNMNLNVFTGLLGLSDPKSARSHLGHLQIAGVAEVYKTRSNHNVIKFKNLSNFMDTMTTEDLMYEWYEIVSPYYPKIAEHLELDNTYDIDVHYPDKVKYELNVVLLGIKLLKTTPQCYLQNFI